jgi:hypothetical protein
VIYNTTTKSPNYHDGSIWNDLNTLQGMMVPLNGRITYEITGTATVGTITVATGQLEALEYGNVLNGPSPRPKGIDSIALIKEFDANSIIFRRAHIGGNNINTIEIKHFLPGAATPFYSIKLSTVAVKYSSSFISEKTGKLTESYALTPTIVGYKDWFNNKSFGYNINTGVFVAY